MSLNDTLLLDLTPTARPYKATDGMGMYLLVQPNGARYWRFRYRWNGVQNTLSCGVYPGVTLEEARAKRDVYRLLLSQGINPSEQAKAERFAQLASDAKQESASRFFLDNEGALFLRIGKRTLSLSPANVVDLRAFLESTRAVIPRV